MSDIGRIFIGSPIPEEITQNINEWKSKHPLKVNWVPAKNFHITLIRPWYAINTHREIKKLQELTLTKHVPIELTAISFKKNKYGSGIIWIEVKPSESLFTMQKELQRIFNMVSVLRFIPHITIARVKNSTSIEDFAEQIDWKFTMTQLLLYRSKRTQDGSKYVTEFELKLDNT